MGIGKINKVKVDLCSYPPYMFLAPRKFGKTTWWNNLVPYVWGDETKGLLIAFEDGYLALDGLQYEPVRAWNEPLDDETGLRGFVQIIDDIVENNAEYGLKGVCIDTLDAMIDVATKEVLRQHKKEKGTVCKTLNEAFSGYGRGKERLRNICNEQIQRLRDAGIAVFFLCHTKSKERSDMLSGEKYEQITNNLNDDIYTNFADDAQMVMVGAFDREINSGKILSEDRVIYLRGTATVDAGSRFTDLPDKISLDVADFMAAFEQGVKGSIKKGSSDDKTIAKMKKEEESQLKKNAEIAKKKDAENKNNDDDERTAYMNILSANYSSAKDDVKKKVKAILANNNCAKLSDPNLPISALKEMVELFN